MSKEDEIDEDRSPSLLEPQSRGGEIAGVGLEFQDSVVLSRVPAWLAQEGFTALSRESIGDTEAKFFAPGYDFARELIESKYYSLTRSDLLKELRRFQEVDAGSPGTYRWFTLISTGLSPELSPLLNGLRRLRGPYEFYDPQSGVIMNSFAEYRRLAERAGLTEEQTRLLFEKVLVEPDWNAARSHGEAVCRDAMQRHLPGYADLSGSSLGVAYANLAKLVKSRINKPVARLEIEAALREGIDPRLLPPISPVLVHTASGDGDIPSSALLLEWESFFGGEGRSYPPPEEWNGILLDQLHGVKDWIEQNRSTRRIRLTGSRRLSAAMAIGAVFSAVAGYTLEMHYRGALWATDAHPDAATPTYTFAERSVEGEGDALVVSVGILRDVLADVRTALPGHGLEGVPRLELAGDSPVLSAANANVTVRALKDAVACAVARTSAKNVHLFFAGPSPVALFLGHRLNAVAPVQCYEWAGPGRYVATCCLFGRR